MYTAKQEDFIITRWTYLFEDNLEEDYDEEFAELISKFQPSEE